MLNKRGLLIKAILFEIKEGFDPKTLQYDEKKAKIPILDEVINFYIRFNECFKYIIKYPVNHNTLVVESDAPSLNNIEKWAEESDIMYTFEQRFDDMKGYLEFRFTNEQDAIAFKLKWL